MTDDEYNILFHSTQANTSAFKRLMDCDAEVIKMIEAAVESENTRLQELADYRLKLLTKMPSEWVGLTDEEILAITFDAKITEPNDEPIKFGAPSRKCIKDLVSGVEAKLKEKNCA